jgi:hypothetical protein
MEFFAKNGLGPMLKNLLTLYNLKKEGRTHNIVLAIVGLTVVNLTFVILLGICTNVGLTFFKCTTIANT